MPRFWVTGTDTVPTWYTGELQCQRRDGSYTAWSPPPRTVVLTKKHGNKNIAFICQRPATSWLIEANTYFLARFDLTDLEMTWGTFDLRIAFQDLGSAAEDVARAWTRYCTTRPIGLDWFICIGVLNSIHVQPPLDPLLPLIPTLRPFALRAADAPPHLLRPTTPRITTARAVEPDDEIVLVDQSPYPRPSCDPRGRVRLDATPLQTPFAYVPPITSDAPLLRSPTKTPTESPPASAVLDRSLTSVDSSAEHEVQLDGLVDSPVDKPDSLLWAEEPVFLSYRTSPSVNARSEEVPPLSSSLRSRSPTPHRPELETWDEDQRGVQSETSPCHDTGGRIFRALQERGTNSQPVPPDVKDISPALERELRNTSFMPQPSPHVQWPLTSSFAIGDVEGLPGATSALGLEMVGAEEPHDGQSSGSGGGDPQDCVLGGERAATPLAATTSSESAKSGAKKFKLFARFGRSKGPVQAETDKLLRR